MPSASRLATSSFLPWVEARARCAAASPPERRSHELSGGGCKPVEEPTPLSPRLIAGLSNSASAGPIGWTSGRWALDFGVLPGFFDRSGFFAMTGIWAESGRHERAKKLSRPHLGSHRTKGRNAREYASESADSCVQMSAGVSPPADA